jgi:hypothetical protein
MNVHKCLQRVGCRCLPSTYTESEWSSLHHVLLSLSSHAAMPVSLFPPKPSPYSWTAVYEMKWPNSKGMFVDCRSFNAWRIYSSFAFVTECGMAQSVQLVWCKLASKPPQKRTQLLIRLIRGEVPVGVKRPGHETDHFRVVRGLGMSKVVPVSALCLPGVRRDNITVILAFLLSLCLLLPPS